MLCSLSLLLVMQPAAGGLQTPAANAPAVDPVPPAVRLVDLDADGLPDKLLLGPDGQVAVAMNRGSGIFDRLVQELPAVVVADMLLDDLDGDGHLDLYLVSPGENRALLGDGTGRLVDATERLGLWDDGRGRTARRIDLDRVEPGDLVLENADGDVVFWGEPGGGFRRDADTPPRGDAPVVAALAALPELLAAGAVTVTLGSDGRPALTLSPAGPGSGAVPVTGLGGGPTPGTGSQLGDLGAEPTAGRGGASPPPQVHPSVLDDLHAWFVDDDAGEVDSADIADGSLTGADISTTSGDVTILNGQLGVGTADPFYALHVVDQDSGQGAVQGSYLGSGVGTGVFGEAVDPAGFGVYAYHAAGTGSGKALYSYCTSPSGYASYFVGGRNYFAGPVGVGTTAPDRNLTVEDTDGSAYANVKDGTRELLFGVDGGGGIVSVMTDHRLLFRTQNIDRMHITADGNVGIGTPNALEKLDVNGGARVKFIDIVGGADLVEAFEAGSARCPPGTVVVIDEERPGQILPASSPYDRRVAGIVSGANGIDAGIRLSQEGALEGDTPVAMAGRVHALCTTENGPIRPGDLLTSSSTPGHAMRATDPDRAFGAVLGKAMGCLDEGTGFVLVLVNLQ